MAVTTALFNWSGSDGGRGGCGSGTLGKATLQRNCSRKIGERREAMKGIPRNNLILEYSPRFILPATLMKGRRSLEMIAYHTKKSGRISF